jgi:hypothetical protein
LPLRDFAGGPTALKKVYGIGVLSSQFNEKFFARTLGIQKQLDIQNAIDLRVKKSP